MPGPRMGLKPAIDDEGELRPTEADVLDLEGEGYLHALPANSSDVAASFSSPRRVGPPADGAR